MRLKRNPTNGGENIEVLQQRKKKNVSGVNKHQEEDSGEVFLTRRTSQLPQSSVEADEVGSLMCLRA